MIERLGVEESPYRATFDLIQQESKRSSGFSSVDAYEAYRDCIGGFDEDRQPKRYFSMAVTSGGHIRQPGLSIPEVIRGNAHYGDLVKQNFLAQNPEMPAGAVVLPSEVGKMEGWNEADYLLFWFHVISGAGAEAGRIENRLRDEGLDGLPGFFNRSLSHDVRRPDYDQLVNGYNHQLMNARDSRYDPSHRIKRVDLILDPELSLGGYAERQLARKLFIATGEIALQADQISEELKTEISILRALGATTINLV